MGLSFSYPDTLLAYWRGQLGESGLYVYDETRNRNDLLRVGNPSGTFERPVSGVNTNQWMLSPVSGVGPNQFNYLTTNTINNSNLSILMSGTGSINLIFYNKDTSGGTPRSLLRTGGPSGGLQMEYHRNGSSNAALYWVFPTGLLVTNIVPSGNQYKMGVTWDNSIPLIQLKVNNIVIASSGTPLPNVIFNNRAFLLGFHNNVPNESLNGGYLGPVAISSDPNFDTRTLGWSI